MEVKVYRLVDPRTYQTRYVGITIHSLERRLQKHISESHTGKKSHKCSWIRVLLKLEKIPIIVLIETTQEEYWQERERYWISFYKGVGESLTNAASGGRGILGFKMSQETIEKMSKASLKSSPEVWKRPEHRKKMTEIHKNWWAKKENRDPRLGPNHPDWGGNQVNYRSRQMWLVKNFGNADHCENPNCSHKSRNFGYSLKPGIKMSRKREDYRQLCRSCIMKQKFQVKRGEFNHAT